MFELLAGWIERMTGLDPFSSHVAVIWVILFLWLLCLSSLMLKVIMA